MTRERFAEQMRRLADGFNTKLTSERMNALWDKYRHAREPVITAVVDELLTGSHYPNRSELDKAVVEATDADNRRAATASHTSRLDWGERCPPERAKFYTRVAQWFYGQSQWPEWSAVEGWANSADLGDRPDDWVKFIAGVWAQNPAGTLPGGLASAAGSAFEKFSQSPERQAWMSLSPEEKAAKLSGLRAKGWASTAPPPSLTAGGNSESKTTPSTTPTLFGLPGAPGTFDPDRNTHGLDCLCDLCVGPPAEVVPVEAEPTPFV